MGVEAENQVSEGEVHVWTVTVEAVAGRLAELSDLLAPSELERAGHFHFERHRQQYIVTRGVLRLLLGDALGVAPAGIGLVEGPHGKPALAEPLTSRMQFNAAHAHGVALLALCSDAPVGVDVERVRPGVDLDGIARRFFAPLEREALARLDPGRRVEAFFACWSRKEAVLKAIGTGISGGLAHHAVSCDPDRPARLLATAAGTPPPENWTLSDLAAPTGFRAAVAVMHPRIAVRSHTWPSALRSI